MILTRGRSLYALDQFVSDAYQLAHMLQFAVTLRIIYPQLLYGSFTAVYNVGPHCIEAQQSALCFGRLFSIPSALVPRCARLCSFYWPRYWAQVMPYPRDQSVVASLCCLLLNSPRSRRTRNLRARHIVDQMSCKTGAAEVTSLYSLLMLLLMAVFQRLVTLRPTSNLHL